MSYACNALQILIDTSMIYLPLTQPPQNSLELPQFNKKAVLLIKKYVSN